MGHLLQDLRYAIRMLLKSPGFAVASILILSLGIGANIAVFSLVDAFLNLPQRFVEPQRLVYVESTHERRGHVVVRHLDAVAWREQAKSFTGIGLYQRTTLAVTGHGEPEQIRAVRTTADLLPMLGLGARLGRLHTTEEDSVAGDRVVVLSDGLWQRRFDSSPEVLGQSISLNGEPHTIIGVLPPEFDMEQMWFQVGMLTPLPLDEAVSPDSHHWYTALARLRPGVTIEQAQAEMDVIAAALAQSYPETNAEKGVILEPLLEAFISSGDRLAMQAMLAAVGLVLIIACANLANLQLARATARGREFAVRTALGAGRSRILSQLMTESLLLAFLGGALGLLFGMWAVDLTVASLEFIPIERHEVAIRPAVVLYTMLLSAVAALASGLAPALMVSRVPVSESLKEGQSSASAGRSRNRLRNALVVAQLAVALPLLITCGLTLRHVQGIKVTDFGFNSERLITLKVDLPEHRYSTGAEMAAFYDEAVKTIAALPGIEAAGASARMPVIMFNAGEDYLTIDGREPSDPERPDAAAYLPVGPGFFETLEVPLLRGRFLSANDTAAGLPVAMINARMAQRYWPDEDPIGRRVKLGRNPSEEDWITIVGEVADTGRTFFGDPLDPTLYLPQEQNPGPGMYIAARTAGDPMMAVPALRDVLRRMDAEVPIHQFRTVDDIIHEVCRDDRLTVGFLAGLAGLSLLLASIGLYGVMSFLVEQRTVEIGVRVALGAGYRDIIHLILKRCLRLAAVGVAAGMALAVPVGLGIQAELWGVTGVDPLAYGAVSIVLLLVALLAGYIPARRAARVDPLIALRFD